MQSICVLLSFFVINTLGLLAALFSFFGVMALTVTLKNWFFKNLSAPNSILFALGFSAYYFTFFLLSLLLPPRWPVYFAVLGFTLLIVLKFKTLKTLTIGHIKKFGFYYLAFGFIVLPFIIRVAGPPVNKDGLHFYLPSIVWIFNEGLSFNPYLTRYTTMPQGVEYLYTVPYFLGNFKAVRIFDLMLGFYLLSALYHLALLFVKKPIALLLVLLAALFPKTWVWLVGQGKVDIIGLLLFSAACYFFYTKQYVLAMLALSSTVLVKYTYWLIIIVPALWFTLANIKSIVSSKKVIALFLPLLFALPLLLKNHIQVNNPLAPLKANNKETKYIGHHYSEGKDLELKTRRDLGFNQPTEEQLFLSLKKGYWPKLTEINGLIYYSLLFLIVAGVLFRKKITETHYWSLLFITLFTLMFWIDKVGVYWWNTRFIWPIWLCLVLLYGIWFQSIFNRLNTKLQFWFGRAFYLVLMGIAAYFYWNNASNFNKTIQGITTNEYEWRKQFGRPQDAMTLKVVDKLRKDRGKDSKIIRMVNPTYGLVPWPLFKKFETEEEVLMRWQESSDVPYDFEGLIMSKQERILEMNLNPMAQRDTIYNHRGIIVLELSLASNQETQNYAR